jgi:hypothetical protein
MDGSFRDTGIRMEFRVSYSACSSNLLDSIGDGPTWNLGYPKGECRARIFNSVSVSVYDVQVE